MWKNIVLIFNLLIRRQIMDRKACGCRQWFSFFILLSTIVLFSTQCSDLPPQLSIDPSLLDFGEETDEMELSISNLGNQTMTWKIAFEDSVSWCRFSPDSGTDDGIVLVTIDRSRLLPGVQQVDLVVESNGGTIKVPVSATSTTTGSIEINEPLPE